VSQHVLVNDLHKLRVQLDGSVRRHAFAGLYLLSATGVVASISSLVGAPWLGSLAYGLLYIGLVVFVLADFWRLGLRSPGRFAAVFVILFAAAVSATQSFKPFASLISVILLGFDFAFAVWLGSWLSPQGLRRLIIRVLLFAFLAGLLVAPINHELLLYKDPLDRASVFGLPNYMGLFPHKIHAGLYNIIGAVCALSLFSERRTLATGALSILFVALVLASGSSLAVVTLVASALIAIILSVLWARTGAVGLVYVVSWMLFLTIIVLVYDLIPYLLQVTGRDSGLTGRVEIWQFGIQYIPQHPWFGGGFGVFFDGDLSAPAQELWFRSPWYFAPSFHSGYIQLFAESGLVGALPFFVMFGLSVLRAVTARSLWACWVVSACLFANLGASLLVTHRSLLFVLLVYFAFLPVPYTRSKKEPDRNNA
jgi:O-antigen ligase